MQTDTRPRFRQDLIAEPVEDGGARFVDLLNPDSGNVFRFYEVEFALACAMDGERDIAGIVQWAKEELGLAPSQNEVRSVIATLGELGYLEGGAARPAVAAQPIAAPSLAAGVVSAQKKPVQPSIDVELGHAGSKIERPAAELPTAPELELGAPGTVQGARDLDLPKVEDVPLGQPGRAAPQVSEVSIDLADQMSIGAEDVKEAVRQSQVMRAVDVPPELLEAVEPVIERREAEAQRPAPQPEPERPVERPQPRPEPVRPAPQPQAAMEQPRPVEQEEKRGPSMALVLLLVIVLIGAAAFLAWRYLLKKEDKGETAPTTPAVGKVVPSQPVEPPKPPPVETAKLVTEQPEPVEVKPIAAGQIEMVAANDSVVKPGDVVLRLSGGKPIETEISSIARDIEKRVKPELAQAEKDRDAAQAAGNKAAQAAAEVRIADRTKSLQDKGAKLAAKQAELDKYVMKASVDGKVATTAKANARVTPTDVVATIARPPVLAVTLHSATPIAPNTKVILAAGAQKLSCTATTTSSDGVKIVCPAEAAKDGTMVSLVGADPSQPQPGSEIELDEDAGSSAGSAAAGSAAAPAAGSAAVVAPTPAPPAPRAPTPRAPARRTTPTPAPSDPPPAPTPTDTPAPAPTPAPPAAPAGSAAP